MTKKRNKVILNVDDVDAGRYTTTRILKKAGFEVWEAASGNEALAKIKDMPDMVILDVNLPDISGLEVCERIKSDPSTSSIPVLHLSAAYTAIKDRVTGLDHGADGYLVQPVEPDELIAHVNALLRLKETEVKLIAANRLYALLSDTNQAIVRIKERDELCQTICKIAVETGKFRMAWVGMIDQKSGAVKPVAHYGHEDGYLKKVLPNIKAKDAGPVPDVQAIRRKEVTVIGDIETDAGMLRWRDEALKRGYRSLAIVPLRLKGKFLGNLTIYADKPWFFTDEENKLFQEIGDDISFALDSIQTEKERQEAEGAIQESEEKYRSLFNQSAQGIYLHELDGRIIDVNETACSQSGYSREELTRMSVFDLHPDTKDTRNMPRAETLRLWNQWQPGQRFNYEGEHQRKDGTGYPVVISTGVVRFRHGNFIMAVVQDITERKKAEKALRASEERYRLLAEHTKDMVWLMDMNLNTVYLSPLTEKVSGFTLQERMELTMEQSLTPESLKLAADLFLKELPKVQADPDYNPIRTLELEYYCKDGTTKWTEDTFSVIRDENGKPSFILGEARDISERKQAKDKLRESEERFRVAQEMSPDGFTILHPLRNEKGEVIDFTWVYENQAIARINGTDPEEVKGKRLLDLFPTHKGTSVFESYINVATSGRPQIIEEVYVGEIVSRPTWLRLVVVSMGEDIAILAQDITERKRAEEAVLRSKTLLQIIVDSSPDWIYVKDSEHRYIMVNKCLAEAQKLAPQDMIGRPDTDFFPEELCLGNPEKGITGYHTEDRLVFQGQIVHDPGKIITWADGSPHIYNSYKIPLADQAGNIYAALVYSRDITARHKAEGEREAAFNVLKRTFQAVIDTLARVVEMRDPYTAGHQRRVAGLASAIAREMNLDDARIEHLIMAAKIHDIGKMYVPSDILSKPGKLNDLEFSLIRTHTQGSYNIIRDIEFSQPVALMALQHHERLDGSGYPNGLKGAELLTESRILAVADVVEAMSSHRPYRPSLGIDKALEEISRNKGKLYDPDVVDTCLELFKSGRFEFKDV